MSESEKIASSIYFLDHGRLRDRKKYLEELKDSGKVLINGYIFSQDDCGNWLIEKQTTEPEFKGETLVKLIPGFSFPVKVIQNILDAMPWVYL